jgi:CheY-like chemotaxis protein
MAPKALVIDDNAVIRGVLRLELEDRGWHVTEAKNPYDGLIAFREIGPQLVTLDLLMPINDGIDALQLARMIREVNPEVSLLIVSSFAANQDLQVFFQKYHLEWFEKANADRPNFEKLLERVDGIKKKLDTRPGQG